MRILDLQGISLTSNILHQDEQKMKKAIAAIRVWRQVLFHRQFILA
jgi:hypothetical protein